MAYIVLAALFKLIKFALQLHVQWGLLTAGCSYSLRIILLSNHRQNCIRFSSLLPQRPPRTPGSWGGIGKRGRSSLICVIYGNRSEVDPPRIYLTHPASYYSSSSPLLKAFPWSAKLRRRFRCPYFRGVTGKHSFASAAKVLNSTRAVILRMSQHGTMWSVPYKGRHLQDWNLIHPFYRLKRWGLSVDKMW